MKKRNNIDIIKSPIIKITDSINDILEDSDEKLGYLLDPIDNDFLRLWNGEKVHTVEWYENLSGMEQLEEILMCKKSFLYWVETYAYVSVTGGKIHMGSSEQWLSSPKFRVLCELFSQHDAVLLLSSRQIGKTTLGLLYALWAMIFFPKIQIMFLTLNTVLAKDAVSRMKSMMEYLPNWMQVANASQAAKTTFIDLVNGSQFLTSFISGAVDPDKAGRGLSQSIILLDEFAFCNHAETVYTAMQPSLATARKFAKLNGYPTLLLGVSTPNGAGQNQFYSMLNNSNDIEDIYDFENKKLYDNYLELLNDPNKNSFISVKIHWSETHRDEDWYLQQCKDLNFNKRRINQELDLAFLGSATSIFDDDIIMKLIPKKKHSEFQLPFGLQFKLFHEIDPNELYFLGADTSASTGPSSDFSVLSLVRASDGQEAGVVKCQFAVVKKFALLLKTTIKGLEKLYGLNSDTLKVIIERNSFGKGVVEALVYEDDGELESYVWMDQYKSGEFVYGFWTGNAGKMGSGRRDMMFSELMNHVNGYPELIHSNELISELRDLVQLQSGRIEAAKGRHDDTVMAYNFCLFVRRQMIKNGELEIDGETQAFGVTPENLLDYIDLSLTTGMNETFSNEYNIYNDLLPEEILMLGLSANDDEPELMDYIIGL